MLAHDAVAATSLDSLAHLIQTALTPVFLLSGIAALLSVFATRLARVSDRGHQLAAEMERASAAGRDHIAAELNFLHTRSLMLDAAVLLGTVGGGATCAAAQLLFIGWITNLNLTVLLYASFGVALVCTTLALIAFLLEVLMASRGMREQQKNIVNRGRALDRQEVADASSSGTILP